MDVPRLFKTATPEFVARKVFKIKSLRRNEDSPKTPKREQKEQIELTLHAPNTKNEKGIPESGHMTEPSNDIETSSTDTGTSKMENSPNSRVPVLAAGTYHRKEAAPILAAAARLDLSSVNNTPSTSKGTGNSKNEHVPPLPHPSECGQPCVSGQSQMFQHRTTTTAQGPPPAWQPPRPPGQSEHDYTNDYEDPEEMARNRDGTASLLMKSPQPSALQNFNSYEMSLSQQRRSQQQQQQLQQKMRCEPAAPLLDWSTENGGVLHKNAEGAYYIPSGSLRTTSSTLSPASSGQRYLDQPHTSANHPQNTAYSDASSTLLKYPLTGTQPNRRRQVSTMNNNDGPPGGPQSIMMMNQKQKKKKLDSEGCSLFGSKPSKCAIVLAVLLLLAILIILFQQFKSPSYVYTEQSPSSDSTSLDRYAELGLRALPPTISLGERIDIEFMPKHMATTEIIMSKSARVAFNATVGSGAQLVLLIRAGVPPSLSLHDAIFPLRADRIHDPKAPTHVVEEVESNSARLKRSIVGTIGGRRVHELVSPKTTNFEYFMLEGRHFLTFINERNRVEPISFIAEEVVSPKNAPTITGEHPLKPVTCEANCNNHGECIQGKCRCANGYTGSACEETICPIVCSGNGVFSGGICVCKTGFKGKECEMRANWCEVADCNGRGRCDTDGKCRCNSGWTGDSCEHKACPHSTCHDRGVCVNGTCYCSEGWRGTDCSVFADAHVPPVVPLPLSPNQNPNENPQKKQKPKPPKPVDKSTKDQERENNKKEIEKRPVVNRELPKEAKNENKHVVKCSKNGKLIDELYCECNDGWNGEDCGNRNCGNNCTNGDCVDGNCSCWKGWNGRNCEYRECAKGCEEHGSCQPDGTCKCKMGYNGENCYQDGCPNQCSGKGECSLDTRSSSWFCQCQAGLTGADCSISIEMHCDDGMDNDNDGLIDCDDPECCGSDKCVEESVCSTSVSPTEVLIRMPPVFNGNFAQRIGFLIKEKSVQSYTDASQFNESLMAVVRGRVVWRGSSSNSQSSDEVLDSTSLSAIPLLGVRVSDASHPLYGFTLTRADGYFDLVVNGARSVNLQFMRTQFQGVKKSVYVAPRQIVHIDDIVLYRSSATPPAPPPPARAKCSPTLRKVPDVVMISNWQYTSDGIEPSEQDSAKLVIDSRSIVESLPVSGTNIRMVYDSTRSPAAPSTMLIGLLDEVIDKDLRKIHLNIKIAGRRFDYVLAPKINLTHVFSWDKMNSYRQSETGLVATTIRVGYEYADCERESEVVWVSRRSQMLGATSRKMIGNMWTFDVHHHLDVVNNIVEMGDGGYRLIEEYEPKVSTLAGIDGIKRDIDCGDDTCSGMLEKISLFRPTALAYALDGSLVIGDHNLIRRIAPDGSINTILTLSLADTSHSYYLAVSPFDGTIAISLPLHKQIWKISSLTPHDSRGNYEVLVGDGSVCGSAVDACGDGGLAQNAQLIFPKGIAYDRVGNLYLADSRRIRVIDTAGHIRSIGETTPESHPIRTCAQITKLVDLQMEWPTSLSIDLSSGLIYVLDTNVVYEIDIAQDLVTVALGVPMTCDGSSSNSGANATSNLNRHLIQSARDISVSNDGSIYVVESDGKRLNQVRKLSADRLKLTVLVGGRSPCSCDVAACGCDDSTSQRQVSASSAHLNSPHSVVIAPSGDVVIADSVNSKVKMVGVRMANYDSKTRSYEVNDAERMQKYTFNRHGLHTSTISMLTGKAVYNFSYNVDSPTAFLTKIYGSSGLSLSVVRYNQTLTDLKTSSGEITSLTLSAYDGNLEMSSRRATSSTPILVNQKDSIRMAYTSKGLLSSKVDVASAIAFEYDKNGRAEGMRREREYWKIGEERISMGRVNVEVLLNGHRFMHVRMGEGDLAILNSHGIQTRLITLQREGYSMTSPYATSSLFDKSGGEDPVVSRRRTTVPAIANPQRRALTTRWDWRYVMKQRGEQRRVAEVDFRPRINGVNMYSMEYDVSKNRDTLRIGSSSDDSSIVLHVEYTDSGDVSRVYQPKGSDENRMDEMNITWDSEGRKERIQWGNWKVQNSYDDRNRVIEKVEDGARVPIKMTYSGAGAARRPTSIQHDGATWNIQYDNYERIKEISSPNGESTSFSAISLGGDEWVLKRKTSSNTKPNLVRIGRNGEIREFSTADGVHHWMVKKDEASGRTEQIVNDGQVIQVTCWTPEGDVLCTKSKQVQENATLQGHLIARKEIIVRSVSDQTISSSFTYEYDDLLRPISIQPVIDQSVVQPIQITYDARTGHVASLNDYNLVRDATTTRCQRNGMLVETSRIESHRQIVERKLVWGDVRASVKIGRDGVGRAIESSLEVNSPGNQKTSKTTRTFDAAGRVASIEENGEKMRINWNQEGRVEKIDDRLVVYHRGGAMMTFLDIGYDVNLIGSVTKRQNISFTYDGKGRLISAKSDFDKDETELIYDNQDRVVLISDSKSNSKTAISLYYGFVDQPHSVSHFSKNGVIFTIFYDENVPFAMVGDDGSRFGLLVDETGTLRVVASDSKIIKTVDRNVFGSVLDDSNREFWVPIGYLGGIDIPGINVTILKNGRPYDLVSGRYLSISPSAVTRLDFDDFANSVDLLALETNMQPFQIPKIPTDVSSFFALVGMSSSLLPAASAQLGLPRGSSIAHRLLSSFPRKLDPLTHLNTIVPSELGGQKTQDIDVMWSIEDAGFSNLLILNQDKNGVVDVETLPIMTVEEIDVVKKIINGAKVIDFGTWSPVPVRHLWKKAPLESLSSASFPHFTLVANSESAELRNGKSKIVVHFSGKKGDVMKKLTDELRKRENLAVWKAERQRLESGEKMWMEWNDREKRELKSKGSVSGYDLELKSTHRNALFATIHSWKFTRA